jgi:3-hydroxyacyl-CoA dehydrogenase
VYDLTAELLDASRKESTRILRFFEGHNLLGSSVASIQEHLQYTRSIEHAARGAHYVQESCSEDYAVKKGVFAQLDRLCPGEVLLASSTSGLLMSEIQKAVTIPQRCVIVHPVNPPHLMPAVEVVPGAKTSECTVERACQFCRLLGRVPVRLHKEVPGFVINRVSAALWREAVDLLVNGVASVEDIDRAISLGPGLRWAIMGPYLVYHLGGGRGGIEGFVENLGPAFETWWASMNTWTSLPPGAKKQVAKGVEEVVGLRSLEELSDDRDEKLLRLLRVLGQEP